MIAKRLLEAIDHVIATADKSGRRHNEDGKIVCFYCGDELKAAHIDHVTPRKLDGVNRGFNWVICCGHCNRVKNAKHPVYWLMQSLEGLPDEQLLDYLARYLYHSLARSPTSEPAWPVNWDEVIEQYY